jgi:hypothetical protein
VFHKNKNCCHFPDVLSENYFKIKVRPFSLSAEMTCLGDYYVSNAMAEGAFKKKVETGLVAQAVESLPSRHKALSSNPSTRKKGENTY